MHFTYINLCNIWVIKKVSNMKKILILLISFNLSAQIDWSNENVCNISTNNEMVDLLVSNMTLEQKVGQVIMPDIDDVTPQEAKDYFLGSILNGGGKFPNKNKYSSIDDWKQLSQEFYNASPIVNEKIIPILWGTDAVHGHNNVIGATIFPHNIGLGAANNTDLMEKIGSAVAKRFYQLEFLGLLLQQLQYLKIQDGVEPMKAFLKIQK